MSDDTEVAFTFLRLVVAGVEGRAETPLGLGDEAFDVPASAVDVVEEPVEHLAPIFGLWPLAPEAARVERDHGGTDAEFFAAQCVSILGVVGFVGQYAVEIDLFCRLCERRNEKGHVVARASVYDSPGDEVGMRVTHDGEFGPMPLFERASVLASVAVMRTDVPRFEPRRVNGALGPVVHQIQGPCALEYSFQQGVESPIFSSRFSAWQRVE